jgi:hypothetical protein
MSEKTPEFPLHRLNIPRTKMWLISPANKRRTADALAKLYRGGVGVCSATLRLMAMVAPNGTFRELAPPFRKYEMWQIANKPHAIGMECPCAEYFDPEVGGAYRMRGTNDHHPMCQFDQTAQVVFKQAQGRAANRLGMTFVDGVPIIDTEPKKPSVIKPLTPQARPDEWERIRAEYRGK